MCWDRPSWDEKQLLHSLHGYQHSSAATRDAWTFMWALRFWDWLNAMSHMPHLWAFTSQWVLTCTLRSRDVVDCLPQTSHSISFSAEWRCLQCLARCKALPKQLTHSAHLSDLYECSCDNARRQWCIGGYTRVYAVYQPPGFFDSVYSPQWS